MAKNINKVIYGGKVLMDLTNDTITAEDLASGKIAHDKSGNTITGINTKDSNTSDANATDSEILIGKTAYVKGKKITGRMPNNEGVEGFISTKDEQYTIPQGYHDGSGKAGIAIEEKDKIIATNIREGITILGVVGTMSGSEDTKAQAKTVTSSTLQQIVVPDEGFNCLSQVTVEPIAYVENPNDAGGMTATIG